MSDFERSQSQIPHVHSTHWAEPKRIMKSPALTEKTALVQAQSLGNQASHRFAKHCPLALPTPDYCPYGSACHTYPFSVQTNLTIKKPCDKYEQEAGRMAEPVTFMPESRLQRACSPCDEKETYQPEQMADRTMPLIQRQNEMKDEEEPIKSKFFNCSRLQKQEDGLEEEDEESIQTKRIGKQSLQVDPEERISSLRGSGKPLRWSERNFFDQYFGYDFSQVRVHSDARAAETARRLGARAFTVGQDIVFGSGQYAPKTSAGQWLLAHELSHVVQQRNLQYGVKRIMRVPREGDIRKGRISYSTNCGWIDWGHTKPDHARVLIAKVREASMRLRRKEARIERAPKLVTEDRCPARYEATEAANSVSEAPTYIPKMLKAGIREIRLGGFGVDLHDATKFKYYVTVIAIAHNHLEKSGTKYAVEVSGFTDCVGSERRNRRLRTDRQTAIAAMFRSSGKTVKDVSYGINQYLESNSTRLGRRVNRGVLIRLVPVPEAVKIEPERITGPQMRSEKFGIVGSGVTPTIELRSSLTEPEVLRVALSILMIQSQLFEKLQLWTDIPLESSFSEEDLPSNLISFYRAAFGYSKGEIRTMCAAWNKLHSLSKFQKYKFRKNRTFRPLSLPAGGAWPRELATVFPINPGTLFDIMEVMFQVLDIKLKPDTMYLIRHLCRSIGHEIRCHI